MGSLNHSIASVFRQLPDFRGKSHLGVLLGNVLVNQEQDDDCITPIKMCDGSLMLLDCRSRTERWAYWTGKYDAPLIAKLARLFTPGFTVLDVGANVGFYSIAWGRRLAEIGGKLYAFEPVSNNFERIEKSISLNHLENVVDAFCFGLSDQQTELSIMIEKTNNAKTGNAVLVHGQVAVSPQDALEIVSLKTLDEFANQGRINRCDLIKVDIEGAEPMFLKGGVDFLSKHRPIIYGEFNSYWMNKFGYSFSDIVKILEPLNYRFFLEVGRNADFIEAQDLNSSIENVLAIPVGYPTSKLKLLGIHS